MHYLFEVMTTIKDIFVFKETRKEFLGTFFISDLGVNRCQIKHEKGVR